VLSVSAIGAAIVAVARFEHERPKRAWSVTGWFGLPDAASVLAIAGMAFMSGLGVSRFLDAQNDKTGGGLFFSGVLGVCVVWLWWKYVSWLLRIGRHRSGTPD
jgi:hypothetical protein